MPAGHQLVVSPVDPAYFVMETTFGLLVSHDSGSTFGWVCEAPIGYGDGGIQDPSVGMTTKSILAGIRQGLSVSFDTACSWNFASPEPVVDLVVRPDDPHTALALTSSFSGVGDAGENLYATQVLVTHDDGATWAPQGGGGVIDPAVQVETIEVARSDPKRIYIGGATRRAAADGGTERVAVVLVSVDGGASYVQSVIPLLAPFETSNGAAFVSAVDPHDANRVYVRIGDFIADRLVVSVDGAATFNTAFQGRGTLLGFALSSDGSQVFVGGPRDGVNLAAAPPGDAGAALSFTHQSAAAVSCLTWANGALYACMGQPQNTFLQQLGKSTDEGATFDAQFQFGCLQGPLDCAGCNVANECLPALPLVRASIGICDGAVPTPTVCGDAASAGGDAGQDAMTPPEDAGPGPSTEAGAEPEPPAKASCGCSAGEAAGAGGLSAFVAVLALGLRRRRRVSWDRASGPR
jgi:MYXO-CTERM domain-containing protein